MEKFEITLSSIYVARPRVHIDLVNPPENLEEIVQTYFGDYTSGTAKEYMDDDKLAYIDLLRDKIHPEKTDEDQAVENMMTDWFRYEIENSDEAPDAADLWDTDFFVECYRQGNKKLYAKQYGEEEMDHHTYDKIHHTLVRIIKAVMDFDGSNWTKPERQKERTPQQ